MAAPMRPGGIGRFKPPAPVYRPCALCGRKHRMRWNGTYSKTGEVLKEERVCMKSIGQYVRLPAGALICLIYCLPKSPLRPAKPDRPRRS